MIALIRKNFSLLSLSQMRQTIVLFSLMLAGMIFEMLGVGLVVPVLAIMVSPDIVDKYPVIQPLHSSLGSPSREQMILGSMMLLLFIYACKSIFLTFLAWAQNKFIASLKIQLSQELFNGYLKQPYIFHVQRNSAELVRNVSGDVGRFSKSILMILGLLANGLNFLGILFLLLWVELFGTSVILILLGVFSLVFFMVVKNRLLLLGKRSRKYTRKSTQHLLQALGGIKDVKLLGRESYFKDQFNEYNNKGHLIDFRYKFITALPGYWFEFIAIIGLVSIVLSLLAQNKPLEDFVPTLGLFAAAAFRLMPATVRVFSAVQQLRFLFPFVEGLTREMEIIKHSVTCLKAGEKVDKNWHKFMFENMFYRYDGAEGNALSDITLSIKSGSTIGIIGQSGSGKSTLVDVFLGLLTPSSGRLLLDNMSVNCGTREWQDNIGYVPQVIYLTDDTIKRNIAFGISDEDVDTKVLKKALAGAQLTDVINTLDKGLDTVVGENGIKLSGGQRQRIGIARALYHNPSILVLDEATSALDAMMEKEVMGAVSKLKGEKTLVIVAHRLTTVGNCDHIYVMDKGRIVRSGGAQEILAEIDVDYRS